VVDVWWESKGEEYADESEPEEWTKLAMEKR
jgi:hypothetical protein